MRQGRNPRGRVHYAGAIGCGRVSRCRLRLCGWVNRVVRRSRSISPHRDPDSAPIRVVSVQRSVFCPSRGLLPSVLPSKGRVHRARFASGRSCVLQSVDSKRVRRTRGVGRTGDGGVFISEHTSVPCLPRSSIGSLARQGQHRLKVRCPLSVCESFPARLPHGGLQRPDKPSMRSGCPPQDP